jgi:hypothetical protein
MDTRLNNQQETSARCSKYDSCSAPICPLDTQWTQRRHLPGERVCLWLREAVKPDGRATLPIHLVDDVMQALPAIEARNSDIRHKLKQAATNGSKRSACHG